MYSSHHSTSPSAWGVANTIGLHMPDKIRRCGGARPRRRRRPAMGPHVHGLLGAMARPANDSHAAVSKGCGLLLRRHAPIGHAALLGIQPRRGVLHSRDGAGRPEAPRVRHRALLDPRHGRGSAAPHRRPPRRPALRRHALRWRAGPEPRRRLRCLHGWCLHQRRRHVPGAHGCFGLRRRAQPDLRARRTRVAPQRLRVPRLHPRLTLLLHGIVEALGACRLTSDRSLRHGHSGVARRRRPPYAGVVPVARGPGPGMQGPARAVQNVGDTGGGRAALARDKIRARQTSRRRR
ncbi:hypothetical protein GQ55_9G323300 [Panicum hallii var. hallii]|uniref:Uncharacterized protein n=1 Tax=Panicum hallii var. hallii TaxID=1504633 RepID=A0A2T7C883_9POAL|nr:hypothetical protein GQ55_9G323300 [Panicum hallii var. hallii]